MSLLRTPVLEGASRGGWTKRAEAGALDLAGSTRPHRPHTYV